MTAVVETAAPPRALGLSQATMVATTYRGVLLPRDDTHDDLILGAVELALLEALAGGVDDPDRVAAAVAERAQTDVASLAPLLDALAARGLLVSAPGGSPPDHTTVPRREATRDGVEQWVLMANMVFRIGPRGFEHFDHDGALDARLSAAELHAASTFRVPTSLADGLAAHQRDAGPLALDASGFEALIARLTTYGVLEPFDPDNPTHIGHNNDVEQLRLSIIRKVNVIRGLDEDARRYDEAREQERATGVRTQVVPVAGSDNYWNTPPLALGYLVAYAKVFADGALNGTYSFHPRWVSDRAQLQAVAAEPGIFMFSNYIWNHAENLELSALIKQANPDNITVHGGPDSPKYEGDAEVHFATHPHADVLVRGEGEQTFAEMLAALDGATGQAALHRLRDVPGLTYRDGNGVVRTGSRDRMTELDAIPSPYLTGLFDTIADGGATGVVLETNRGCPYGCTFCDWGSATASRIRKFDLDRVLAELEWCAKHEISYVGLADANYGIFERDVVIAERVAELKAAYGYPVLFGTNYAKNTVKHLRPIIEVLAKADIITEGVVSLQSMDEGTLDTIRRHNIKLEKYNDLAAEFRKSRLPLSVDLMLGLPGSTATSFRNDLQECANREVRTRVYPTTLLPNSPMNEPAYREEHGIVAQVGEVLTETASFTREEWDKMVRLRAVYLLGQRFGALRYVAAYVRQETGLQEVAFFERLLDDVSAQPDRWPSMAYACRCTAGLMAPPCSWRHFRDELEDYLTQVLGIEDEALGTALAVQHAMQPAGGRTFPLEIKLDHDFEAWYQGVLAAKDEGRRTDWERTVPRLREFGPATFVVSDPNDACRRAIGGTVDSLSQHMTGWELGASISRA